jgi:trk system potassium uptake protein TrkH
MIGVAQSSGKSTNLVRSHLLALLGAFTILPVMLAVPFYEGVRNTTFLNAWFEMVSSLTTTGATLFDAPGRIADTLHLWRAVVGWLGGLLTWVVAISVLAPLNLGGFEVIENTSASTARFSQITRVANASERLVKHTGRLFPVYAGLTFLLWIGLLLAGDTPLVAISHAMSTLSTSGISPLQGTGRTGGSGIAGEMLVFLFLFFALSRLFFTTRPDKHYFRVIGKDPEIRMALFLVIVLPALLFLRHWVGSIETSETRDFFAAIRALWGSAFTVLSFLTTTGFESTEWASARGWSGLESPGLILLGLSIIGGGVATTAGGVKLMRVYALYVHGNREMERLIHPSSVGGSGMRARHIRRRGAHISWIFFMLFAMSIAVVMLLLSFTHISFDSAMVFAVSALSTTGPLALVAAEHPQSYVDLGGFAKTVLAAAMVLGRLETIAIIALLYPGLWRE